MAPTQNVRLSSNLNSVRSFTALAWHVPLHLPGTLLRALEAEGAGWPCTVLKLTSPERTSMPEISTSIDDQIQLSLRPEVDQRTLVLLCACAPSWPV